MEENQEVVLTARRTESVDASSIQNLMTSSTFDLFGRIDVMRVIEKANLAITLVSSDDEVVANGTFFDYPNVSSIDQAKWEKIFQECFKSVKPTIFTLVVLFDGIKHCSFSPDTLVSTNNDTRPMIGGTWWMSRENSLVVSDKPLNSLFMNFFVSKPDYIHGCATEILRTVFNTAPYIEYIFLMVPQNVDQGHQNVDYEQLLDEAEHNIKNYPDRGQCYLLKLKAEEDNIDRDQGLLKLFSQVKYNENFSKTKLQISVQVCHRYEYAPRLHIRAASVEDHDDLTPIFDEQSDALINTYGDFFLNDLIEAVDEENKCIVADVNGTAVGFMSVRSNVNTSLLNECFDLTPFDGLRKGSPTVSEGTSEVPTPDEGNGEKEDASVGEISEEQITESHSKSPEGEENVFCIELFCIDEKFEARSMDFLPAAFDLFPGKDYCVITMPHIVNEFPLVHEFTRVTPKADATISHELYVFHRWGLLRSFNVRPAISTDTKGIRDIIRSISGSEAIMRDVDQYNRARRDQDGQELRVLVAECMKQIVGVAVIRQEESKLKKLALESPLENTDVLQRLRQLSGNFENNGDIEFIRAHYAIEDFIYYNYHQREEHAHLFHFTLNAVFRHYRRYFLKEILRLSHKSCLYYTLYPKFVDPTLSGTKPYTVISCLGDLVPVRSRRQIIYHEDILGLNAPSKRVLKKTECYALYHLNRKLTLEPKVVINARIVVVGASDTGISFLEKFCFCPHLHFKNIFLITPQGLPGEFAIGKKESDLRPTSCCYSKENYAEMALRTWINVVEDKMVAIDRERKVVTTSQGRLVRYDYLVLCCGQQFQIPIPSGADITTLVTTAEVPRSRDKVYKGNLPRNVFTINSERDARDILRWVEETFVLDEGVAVIYGPPLESYTFMQGLLTSGVPGSRIVLVQPPQKPPTPFNNPDVEALVEQSLQKAGIIVYQGYTLARWNDRVESSDLKNASFTSSNKPLMLDCEAFFCFQEKKVDYETYKAINDSCLVYDGKLVVDKDFLTNDPVIRAAGPLTKFARRYHSDSWTHANFSSKEVGKLLAMSMLPLFDPTLEQSVIYDEREVNLIPVFKEPKMSAGMLPGGFHYLHVGKPTLGIRLDSLMAQSDYGRVLITGTPGDEGQGYFRLHINQYNAVETITCLSKQPIDTKNIICLYGVHERYLNNLCQRYEEGLIKDFFSYFKESWCVAIFHDRFKDLCAEIREILSTVKGRDGEIMSEKVRKLLDEDLVFSNADRERLRNSYMKSSAKTEIEKTLLNFLDYNSPHLPMYAKPEMV